MKMKNHGRWGVIGKKKKKKQSAKEVRGEGRDGVESRDLRGCRWVSVWRVQGGEY